MGIKERHERDREAVRRAILDAARELFVREGYANVSIRKIAERIEYSPAAIYSYFPSKDDVFFELAEEGFRLLGGDGGYIKATQHLPPLERIRTLFWHVYEFSRDQPQYFALLFLDRSVPRIGREYARFTFVREVKRDMVGYIKECIEAKLLPTALDPLAAFRLMTLGLIGVCSMSVSGRLAPGENAGELARDMLDALIAGFQSGIVLHSISDSASAAASGSTEE
jgi:AcrR family transcriptional regulator